MVLNEGDKAPSFTATAADGHRVRLADFRGQNVILYFYPRDNTPGCTREACGFRDEFEPIRKAGAVILGVSTDSTASHAKFASRHRLPFLLLSDADRRIVRAYGVWGEKKFLGRTYQGTLRTTFWIGPDGRIRKIWRKVSPANHAREVLAALQA